MSIDGINDFSKTLKDVKLEKTNSFKVGEIIKGKVMGFSDGKPILSLKGEIFSARSEVPLKLDQEIDVFVQKKEGATTFLKIIDPSGMDTDSKILNTFIKENIQASNFDIAKYLFEKGIDLKNIGIILKKGLKSSNDLIDIFKNFQNNSHLIKDINTLYSTILKSLSSDKKEEFLNRFIPNTKSTESIKEFLKESLYSTENKLLTDKNMENDLKLFINKNIDSSNKNILSKLIDFNNILSNDEKNEIYFQIPYFYNEKTGDFKYSQLSFKSSKRFKEKDIVNIFFILDMSKINTLKINANYYIKGKNLDITFQTSDKYIKRLFELEKKELEEKLKKTGLNCYISVKEIEENNKKKSFKNYYYKRKSGIDIEV